MQELKSYSRVGYVVVFTIHLHSENLGSHIVEFERHFRFDSFCVFSNIVQSVLKWS